ncbi:cobalamin B12-binding domain-containing protein [Kitasatospora sp. NPDC059327]|uniref:cobalamin B12-binding domain-containing protein n=1 Tax=Kitasatospora sp. NPDC059327 TaxID=3346803 RepID=UPI003686CEB5
MISSPAHRRRCVLSSVSSDSHTWNLVFLQLLLEENGYQVENLGACVPDDLLLEVCLARVPDAVVISTVNGHGRLDGIRLARRLRAEPALARVPMMIGGKLGLQGTVDAGSQAELIAAGFDAVFEAGSGPDVSEFLAYLGAASAAQPALAGPAPGGNA